MCSSFFEIHTFNTNMCAARTCSHLCLFALGFFSWRKKINILNAKARSLSIGMADARGREVNEALIERRNEPNTPDNEHYIMVFSDWLSPWMCEMACTIKRDARWISTVFFRATFDFVGSLDRVLNFKENEISTISFFTGSTKCVHVAIWIIFVVNGYPRWKRKIQTDKSLSISFNCWKFNTQHMQTESNKDVAQHLPQKTESALTVEIYSGWHFW